MVARLPAPDDPNAPRAGYRLPATLVTQAGNPPRGTGASVLPAQPAMQEPGITHSATQASTQGTPKSRNACCESALVDPDAVAQVQTASGTLPVAMDLYAPLRATKALGVRAMAAIANPVHSIIGNRGRGDGSAGSDGVVPVRSARIASAESELVVPTGHGGFDHPAAVAEIKRIVFTNVAQQQTVRN